MFRDLFIVWSDLLRVYARCFPFVAEFSIPYQIRQFIFVVDGVKNILCK